MNDGMKITTMIEYAPVCCIFFDDSLKIINCNKHALDLLNISCKENIIGTSLCTWFPKSQVSGEDSVTEIKQMLKKSRQNGVQKFDWLVVPLSGADLQTEATIVPAFNDNQECAIIYLRAERRLRAVFENIPMACHFRNKDHKILECNQMGVELFGFRDKQEYKEHPYGRSPKFQPDGSFSDKKMAELIDNAFKNGYSRFNWTYIDANENDLPAEVTIVRVKYNSEDHVLALINDIREAQHLRDAERAFRERLQLMLDSSPLACSVHDEKLKIIEANQEVVNLFGLSNKQQYIDNFPALSPEFQPDGRLSSEKMFEVVRDAFELGRNRVAWMHQTISGEEVPCEITMVSVMQGEQNLMISYINDLREINAKLSMIQRLEHLAYIDPLTEAFNRRYFMEHAELSLQENIADSKPFSLIMADIDFFKNVNDTYGHDIGDEVLKILVSRFKGVLRDAIVARYGGEEFVILLPDTANKNAIDIAWRLQKNIADSKFRIINKDKEIKIAVTSSFGVASYDNSSTNLSSILKNADVALYQAKANGRNTVAAFS